MGKILISEKFLKNNYLNVAFAHANYFAQKNNLNIIDVQNEFNNALNDIEFKQTFHKYFENDVKLIK